MEVTPQALPKANLKVLFGYLREHRLILTIAIALSLIGAVAALVQPLLVSQVIQQVQAGLDIAPLAAVLVALVIASALLNGLQHYLLQRTGTAVVRSARRSLVRHMLRLPIREYDTRRTGDLVSRVGSDTTLLYAVVTQGLIDSVAAAFMFIGAVIAMAVLDALLLSVTLSVVVVALVAVVLVSRRMRKASKIQQERVGDVAAAVERSVSAVRTIRATNSSDRESEAIVTDVDRAYDAGVQVAKYSAVVVPIAGITLQIALLAVLGLGGFRVASGDLSIANLVAFLLFLFLIIGPLGTVFGTITSVNQALGALARIQELMEVPAEQDTDAKVARRAKRRAGSAAKPKARAAIEFQKVTFGYESGQPVLQDVSFVAPRGKRIALVGPSGAGKSTTLALIERFYDVTDGAVFVNGVDVRLQDRDELRSLIGYVEQEAPVLSGTLRNNLLLGSPNATDADCERVLRAVNLGGVLKRNPAGLDAMVGESGVMLSGGERQRLAIARALLQEAPILLLDESTSSLDGVNEQLMRKAIDAVATGRTLIVIAHRLSTVIDSDVIVMMEHGRVLGVGTHDELLAKVPLYRTLAEHQLLA